MYFERRGKRRRITFEWVQSKREHAKMGQVAVFSGLILFVRSGGPGFWFFWLPLLLLLLLFDLSLFIYRPVIIFFWSGKPNSIFFIRSGTSILHHFLASISSMFVCIRCSISPHVWWSIRETMGGRYRDGQQQHAGSRGSKSERFKAFGKINRIIRSFGGSISSCSGQFSVCIF